MRTVAKRLDPRFLLLPLAVTASGCATVEPRADYDSAVSLITKATGSADAYKPSDDEFIDAKVESLLDDGLTVEEAVRGCLLNNPNLQAAFYRIGMARADVVQSQLLSNPSVGVSTRFPAGGGLVNLEASIAQNIVDLWQLPLRKTITEHTLQQTILEIATQATTLAYGAKASYYRAKAADRFLVIAQQNRQAASQLVELSQTLLDAGAGSGVDVNLARSELQTVELSVRAAQLESFEARASLTRTLGLSTSPSTLLLVDDLPSALDPSDDLDRLLQLATENRLDLAAARHEMSALATGVDLEKQRVFRVIEIGVEVEREARRRSSDGSFLGKTVRSSIAAGALTLPGDFGDKDEDSGVITGPSFSIELPIFDQNQAQIAKAEFGHAESLKLLRALLLDIAYEVRLAHQRARTTWSVAKFFEGELLPLHELGLELAQEAYQAGKIPLITVLEAQRTMRNARAGYLRVLLDRALAWTDLQLVTASAESELIESITRTDTATSMPNEDAATKHDGVEQ